MSHSDKPERRDPLLIALERLLSTTATEVRPMLNHAAEVLGSELRADKVDVFFHDPSRESLVAAGTSDTPMSRKQVALGLERLPIVNGGRAVEVFQTGKPFLNGKADEDTGELIGVRQALNVRSQMMVPLRIGGAIRGVIGIQSEQRDFFSERDLRFLEAVANWIGVMAHRAELSEELIRRATLHARRAAAEEIITVLAHDLGNHIGPLRARIDLLRIRAEREGHKLNLRDSRDALLVVARLNRLISDLLDVARVDEGLLTLSLQPTDLARMARDVAQVASTEEREVVVRGEVELVVSCDPERIRQALENLVANAVKHSPPKSQIIVEVSHEERAEGAMGVVHVIDQGPGIAPELLSTLFDRFVTGSRSRGLGLGLYLARQFVEAHGGTLRVESTPGKGARFELSLPVQPAVT